MPNGKATCHSTRGPSIQRFATEIVSPLLPSRHCDERGGTSAALAVAAHPDVPSQQRSCANPPTRSFSSPERRLWSSPAKLSLPGPCATPSRVATAPANAVPWALHPQRASIWSIAHHRPGHPRRLLHLLLSRSSAIYDARGKKRYSSKLAASPFPRAQTGA